MHVKSGQWTRKCQKSLSACKKSVDLSTAHMCRGTGVFAIAPGATGAHYPCFLRVADNRIGEHEL